MGGIINIIDGTFKNLMKREQELYESRIKICKQCPLYLVQNKTIGAVCNSKLYLNPDTNETSKKYKPGFKSGCGCILASKTRVKGERCPLDKW